MEATLLLCDFAEEVGGKLYIMGGGWSQTTANVPISMALAVRLLIPWDQTNVPHRMEASLLTQDGQPVTVDDNPIRVDAEIEVGRPPGTKPGMAIDAPFAVRFNGLAFEAGLYRWDVKVNDEVVATASFAALNR